MKNVLEFIRNKIVEILIASVFFLASGVSLWVLPKLKEFIIKHVPYTVTLRVLLISIILLYILLSIIIYMIVSNNRLNKIIKNKNFIDDFEFIKEYGLYKHKENNMYYCGSCTANGILSPLKEETHGWKCQRKDCNLYHSKTPDDAIVPFLSDDVRTYGNL